MQPNAVQTVLEPNDQVAPAHLVQLWDSLYQTRQRHFPHLRIVRNHAQLERVRDLRVKMLQPEYPDMVFRPDRLDYQSLIMYTIDDLGIPNSTARLVVEGPVDMPQETFIVDWKEQGHQFCEWSRFAIDEGNQPLLKSYYRAMYLLVLSMNVDSIVMSMKPNHIALHQRLCNIRILEPDMNLTYGGVHRLACVVWELSDTKARFFKWVGGVL